MNIHKLKQTAEYHIKRGDAMQMDPKVILEVCEAMGQAEPVALPKFNCWSTSEGDSWFDHPADAQAIYERLGGFAKVGDEYELLAGWRSVTARYRIVSIDGDDFEVECVSHTHPAQPVQPDGAQEPVAKLKQWYDENKNLCRQFEMLRPGWEGEAFAYEQAPAAAINEQLLEALQFAYVLLKDQCMDTALVKLKIETAIRAAEAEKAKGGCDA